MAIGLSFNNKNILGSATTADSIQVFTMPTASADELDNIYQYIGTTDTTYTNGYFYKCTTDGITYEWENVKVQEATEGSNLNEWATNTDYEVGDVVIHQAADELDDNGSVTKTYYPCLYICLTDHTSTIFEDDSINWMTIDGTDFEYYTIEELQALTGLSEDELNGLEIVLSDTEVRTDKTWSSSKIYGEMANLKTWTEEEIVRRITGGHYKIVTSESEVVDSNYLYLIDNGNDSYYVYILDADGTVAKVGTTNIDVDLKIDPTTKNWVLNGVDLGVCAEGKSVTVTENANNTDTDYKLDFTQGDGTVITTPNLLGDSIAENGNNTTSDYRLDITHRDGTVTTTDNLHGIDATQVANHGFFALYIRNDCLYLLTDNTDESEAPPFSVRDGRLYYTVGGTIQYESKRTI